MSRQLTGILSFLLLLATLSADGRTFHDETLHYKVMFKWGIIHKQAGRATLQLRSTHDSYTASLFARSESWADKIYTLRDTLVSTISRIDMLPIHYQRIAHEDGNYARDIVEFSRVNNRFDAVCTRYRKKKGGEMSMAKSELSAEGVTVDMLSVFYYLRSLDFAAMHPGQTQTINIFSGKRKELLKITYQGKETIQIDGYVYPTFRINFTFTSDGKKKTSDGIDTWIWDNASHIPVKLEGHLKVGKIRCLYTPAN